MFLPVVSGGEFHGSALWRCVLSLMRWRFFIALLYFQLFGQSFWECPLFRWVWPSLD
jgi:hypothetical protein